ncbi:hypothetical protein WISP_78912 [Willisornis vidua]|uniref:Peptidase A2 domain-containing protein n=1 Tax=Willisornis vidua TaxID=1566151 RepID=A0ABQ9D9Z4_9PASS|nr:hypothetical protein WISP_78912 [Willisornis vidua]
MASSLWIQILRAVRARYPFEEYLMSAPREWNTVEEGIQYLREVVMLEIIYYDPDYYDILVPEKIVRTRPMWDKEEERDQDDNRVYWAVWVQCPGTSDARRYQALVDTGAQYTLMPSGHESTETVSISGVTKGSQDLSVVEAGMSLTGDQWEKHSIVTEPEVLGMDYLKRGHFKDPKGYRWAFDVATVIEEKSKQLSTLLGLSEDPSAVGLLRVEDQEVPMATATIHRRLYWTNRDAVIPIHKMIRKLESQGVVSGTPSPFNSPIWPVRKSDGEWRLTVNYRGLNEVTPPLSAAVPDMLELQYELETKAAKWYTTIDMVS